MSRQTNNAGTKSLRIALIALLLICFGQQAFAQIVVETPESDDEFLPGDTIYIYWYWSGSPGSGVSMDLKQGGNTIIQNIASGGQYDSPLQWQIPLSINTGDYHIYADETGGSQEGTGEVFSIVEGYINISSSYDESSVEVDDGLYFTWSHEIVDNDPGTLDLDYRANGGSWQDIATLSYGASNYDWDPPNALAGETDVDLRLRSVEYTDVVDYISDLELYDLYITMDQISGGYERGTQLPITYTSTYSDVDIDLVGPDGANIETSYSGHPSSPAQEHTYNWTIDSELTPGDYKIEVSSGTDLASSGWFRIGDAARRIISYDDYDSYGNLLKATDANGNVTRLYYGSSADPFSQDGHEGINGAWLTGISRIEEGASDSLTSEATYDSRGRLTAMTGENGVDASFDYDEWGRLETVYNDASNSVMTNSYVHTGSQFSATNPNYITATAYPGGGASARVGTRYLDGLGRSIQSHQEGAGSTVFVSAMQYDSLGRQWKTWKPYDQSGTGFDDSFASNAQSEYGDSRPFLEQRYEDSPLDRPDSTIVEGETDVVVIQSYDVDTWNSDNYLVTTSEDEEGNVTETWTDGWGRTVRTIADPGGIAAETVFEYDELDRLTKVTAPNGTETTYNYNTRGAMTSRTSDDAGTTAYLYDAAGNLRFTQDANRAASDSLTYMSYDDYGRIIREGVADEDFNIVDPDVDNGFETSAYNLHGAWAYDSKPSVYEYPWDQFSSFINSTTLSNTEGQLAARAWR